MTDQLQVSPLYAGVVGQAAAVANLRAAARAPVHAYLLVGQAGTGVREAARAFAADVLCAAAGCGVCRSCANALAERHPDLVFVERSGASIRVQEIDEVIRLASRPPSEGCFKVIALVDFHLVDQHYARLLKTLEEPPPSTVFLVLAEQVPPELVTIASRCVRIDFAAVPAEVITSVLVSEGTHPALAEEVALAAAGRLDRARLLAADPGFSGRRAAWC
nr:DNA polymerase III subunit delta' [Actinomycetota bacterium]